MINHSHPSNKDNVLSPLTEGLLYLLLFSASFLFLPILGNPFDIPKLVLVVFSISLTALVWAVQSIRQKRLAITLGTPQLALLAILATVIASTYMQKIYAINALPSTFGVMTMMIILALFVSEIVKKINTERFVRVMYGFGIVLTILAFLQAVGFGISKIINSIFSVSLPENFSFSPSGSALVTTTFLIALLIPIAASFYREYVKTRSLSKKVFEIVSGIILTSGIIFHGYLFISNQLYTPQILPVSANWSMAADTLKTQKELLLGFGPTRFADAYTAKRPVSLNSTNHWNILYQVGSNTPLSLMVSLGIIATIAWLYLALYLVLTVPSSSSDAQSAGWLALGATFVQFILPPNLLIMAVQFIALGLFLATNQKNESNQKGAINFALKILHGQKPTQADTPASLLGLYLGSGAVIIAAIISFSAMLKVSQAEYLFFQAGKSFQANQVSQAYELQKKAISANPYNDGYHRAYAQTNLALATALSSKKDITDNEKQTIAQLLQQSIRESRAATSINPYRSQNWRTMATIYRALVGSTKDADQWAVAAYNQAIQTSPNDPTLRVDLGGLFYFAKNYEIAEQLFQQSVVLKPDYANGYYNLAKTREQANKLPGAVLAYQQVLRLVDASSDDYITAQKELTTLVDKVNAEQAKIAKQQPTVTPSPTPEAEPTPAEPKKVELPKEAKEDVTILEQEPENPQLATESAAISP